MMFEDEFWGRCNLGSLGVYVVLSGIRCYGTLVAILWYNLLLVCIFTSQYYGIIKIVLCDTRR